MHIPEKYLQGSGALGTAGSWWRDAQASLLGQFWTVYSTLSSAVGPTVVPDESGRRTRSRVIDAR